MKKNRVVLFVSHKKSQCGIYEFGRNIYQAIKNSNTFDFRYVEAGSLEELKEAIRLNHPVAIIYNFFSGTMPWALTKLPSTGKKHEKIQYLNRLYDIPVIQIGIIHSIEQFVADEAVKRQRFVSGNVHNKMFDYYITPDPTLVLKNPLVYKTGRPLFKYTNPYTLPEIPVFGSATLATGGKGFAKFIGKVQQEYDKAKIRINIPKADFDEAGIMSRYKREFSQMALKPGIELEITNHYFSTEGLLDFLAQNTANFYLYDKEGTREDPLGISSALDNAMSVKRPVIISHSSMFRHVLNELPYLDIDKSSIRSIVEKGFAPLEDLYREWQPECMCWEYERILKDILIHYVQNRPSFLSFYKNVFTKNKNTGNPWVGKIRQDDMTPVSEYGYSYADIPSEGAFNRILDDSARTVYGDTVSLMESLVPESMKGKIKRANVQQAFVLDCVLRFKDSYKNPRILCIGCYTDTAFLSLKKLGIPVFGNDPVLNYDFDTYISRPDQRKKRWDIIISTSVIEHVEQDEDFVGNVASILSPGGIFVMTCDFKEDYQTGDPKPDCDFRFYTEKDLKERLIKCMPGCHFVGGVNWHNVKPDFGYGRIRYNFASFVVKKENTGGSKHV